LIWCGLKRIYEKIGGDKTERIMLQTFLSAAQLHVGFDQLDCPAAKLITVRIFHPHMQQADKEQMRIDR
jgi:hypothetical protein